MRILKSKKTELEWKKIQFSQWLRKRLKREGRIKKGKIELEVNRMIN